MNRYQVVTRALAAAATLVFATSSQAVVTFVSTPAAFNGGIGVGPSGTDNFNDLTINSFFNGPVNRFAGVFGYRASTTMGDFFVAPVAGTRALSMELSTSSIVLDNFTRAVFAVGGNFFNTNIRGEFTGGSVTVLINDVNGGSFSNTFTPTSITGYAGFLSDTRINSVTIFNASTGSGPWGAVDNLTLAVPEPGSLALMLAGLGVVATLARRTTKRNAKRTTMG